MPTRPRPYTFLDTAAALEAFAADELDNADGNPIALDIEEDREHRFNPSVALIQITIDTRDFVIDPLTIPRGTLDSVIEFLCLTPSVVVMHGCRNDVTGLKRDFGVGPQRVQDTQTAARFLGRGAFGLAALLEAEFDVKLDKAVRRSNWLKRPLTEKQLEYAREDTRYLLPLIDRLDAQAREAGWGDALDEEYDALAELYDEPSGFDPFGWRKIKGIKKLSDDAQLRAAAIWTWRDAVAEKIDQHPSRVLAGWAVELHARKGINSLDVDKPKGLSSRVSDDDIDALLDLVEDPPKVPLKRPREVRRKRSGVSSDVLDARMTRLRQWRADVAEETGLDPGFLAPNGVLEAVARANVSSPEGYRADDVRSWRLRRWADEWFELR